MTQIYRHYLQSESWNVLRSEYRKEVGFDKSLNPDGTLRLSGHISRERRAKSLFHNYVLEALYGPYSTGTNYPDHLDTLMLKRIIEIAKESKASAVRFHGYLEGIGVYYPLGVILKLLSDEQIEFNYRRMWTALYDLNAHVKGNLDYCDSSVRKNLRKASSIQIVRVQSEDDFQLFLVQHFKIKKRTPPKAHEINAYRKHNSNCTFFLAYESYSQECIGTLGFVHDEITGMEVMSSAKKDPRTRGVQEKLHLACFDEGKRLGLKFFDLAGLEKSNTGTWNSVAQFKLKFGGLIVDTGSIEFNI